MDGFTAILAGGVLPNARSVDADARTAIDALGCDPVRPRIHLGLFVHRVEGVPRASMRSREIPTSSRLSRK